MRRINLNVPSYFAFDFIRQLKDYRLKIRLTALLLISALLLPVILFDPTPEAKAQSNIPFQAPAPVTAPPEPYLVSSQSFISAIDLPAFQALAAPISNSYSRAASFIAGPQTPEGLGAATPPPTLTERFTGFLGSFFSVNNETSSTNMLLPSCTRKAYDFDGDCKADFSRWQANSFQYKIHNSGSNTYTTLNLGSTSSKIAPADFDGDGKFDPAVFAAGSWTVRKSTTNTDWTGISWGTSGDLPVPADYDNDGTADFAVYRSSTNTFWVLTSSSGFNSYYSTALGISGDIAVPGDFDGNGSADYAVFRPSTGHWYYKTSTAGNVTDIAWGISTDIPAPGDFDSDGKTDPTVFRPSTGTWYIYKSTGGSPNYIQTNWGNLGDQPVPADYDGDGTSDLAIYRPTTGAWWVQNSGGSPAYTVHNLGTSSDLAVPSAYLKQSGAELYPDQLSVARLAPINATGGTNYYSRNSAWGTNLVSLPGRAGMNLSIAMGYNSLVWTKVGTTMAFDMDKSNLAPGFNFGFSRIEPAYVNAQTSILSYLMVSPSGGRTEFRQTAVSDTYETADSSYAQIKVNNPVTSNNPTPIEDITLTVRGTDGTQMSYAWIGNAYRCTKITDRNGNFITISNNSDGQLTSVTDTLGRVVTINYDSYARPSSITQNWQMSNGSSSTTATHTWASFTYATKTINTSFDGSLAVYGPTNNTSISVLDKVTFPDGSYTKFDYNGYAQVYKISNYAANNDLLNYTWRNIESPSSSQTDCPRFTQTKTKVANFNLDQNGAAQEITYNNTIGTGQSYTLPHTSGTAAKIEVWMDNDPYSSVTKTYVGSSGWMEGLPIATEDYANDGQGLSRKRWTWAGWTQDNTGLSYIQNPRLTESRVGDTTNTKKTQTDYYLQTGTNISSYGLVKEVRVYDSDLSTVLKKSVTEYKTDTAYISRRLVGLPSKIEAYGRETTGLNLMSKVTFEYDEGNFSDSNLQQNILPIHHDTSYGSSFITGRGNLTSTTRWDAINPTNQSNALTSSVKYNTAGAVVAQISPWTSSSTRQVTISYADKFNDGNDTRETYAYPTKIIDPENYYSEVIYRYDIGANVWARSPLPQGPNNTQGKVTTREFDSIGRLEKETIVNNGAYTRYEYPANGVQSKVYSTLVDVDGDSNIAEDEVISESWADGAGRVRYSRTEHPGSTGGYRGALTEYDILGRVKRASIPTEIDSYWNPTGDDYTRGWLWTQQEYDWKGRVKRIIPSDSTGSDGKDQLFSYDGCGCAGGQVTTIQSESVPRDDQPSTNARRVQKVYEDILGRTYKTEVMDWSGTNVYTATVQTFNGRDQVTKTRQYAGTDSSSAFQDVTMAYDGHGRMSSRHYPIEDGNAYTSWIYNPDDSIKIVTDPRGAMTDFTYNARGLVTHINYTQPTNYPPSNSPDYMNIPTTPSVDFTYDAAGNRTVMDDGPGSVSYEYDELSRLKTERRYFDENLSFAPTEGVTQVFKIEYGYNLSGGLKYYKEPYGEQINYTNDKTGRLTAVDGTPFGDQNDPVEDYSDGIQYRAWGAIKQLNYNTDDNALVKMYYDNRLRVSQHEIQSSVWTGGYVKKAAFSYFADSRPQFFDDQVHTEFDRTYKYDFAGRLTSNQFGTPTVTPYIQTNTYDAFSNLTGRSTNHWYKYNGFSSTFTNGRESTDGIIGTKYDAAGNQVHTGSRGDATFQTRQYDVANRVKEFTSHYSRRTGRFNYIKVKNRLTRSYDGDGHELKQTEDLWNNTGQQWVHSKTDYQIWSTVLGSYLTEIGMTGRRTKVFAGGAVIAEQSTIPGANNTTIETVEWIHADPVSGSMTRVNKDGTEYYRTEYEPLGNQEVHTAGDQEDYPEPVPSSIDPVGEADDPQWQCQIASAIGTSFLEMPTHCQRAALANASFGDLHPSEYGTQKIVILDSPIRGPKLPVNITPTLKPNHTFASNAVVPKASFPSSDKGLIISNADKMDIGEVGYVEIKDFWDTEKLSAEFGFDIPKKAKNAIEGVREIFTSKDENGENSCADFFKGKGLDALAAFISKLDGNLQELKNADGTINYTTGIKGELPGNYSQADVKNGVITPLWFKINKNGGFINRLYLPLTQTKSIPVPQFHPDYINGTIGSQILQILHELGHLVLVDSNGGKAPLLPIDGGNADLSKTNTETVLNNCKTQIKNFVDK